MTVEYTDEYDIVVTFDNDSRTPLDEQRFSVRGKCTLDTRREIKQELADRGLDANDYERHGVIGTAVVEGSVSGDNSRPFRKDELKEVTVEHEPPWGWGQ